jgi:hypothetical protein
MSCRFTAWFNSAFIVRAQLFTYAGLHSASIAAMKSSTSHERIASRRMSPKYGMSLVNAIVR